MPTKVNVVLDDDVKAERDRLVESGKRSRVINSALRREIHLLRRRAANVRLDEIRAAWTRRGLPTYVKRIGPGRRLFAWLSPARS